MGVSTLSRRVYFPFSGTRFYLKKFYKLLDAQLSLPQDTFERTFFQVFVMIGNGHDSGWSVWMNI